ncbi:MAG TPA: hypothetical protein DDZ20_19905 [Hyphomonas sp.]|nr:hypothetical protein [Hyphomonas sp.]HBX93503.1 hypothetical protein [Hyphomonas sp.]|tara:strand:+ start:457 stop:636 length:180 start_codon:yes stop_codon:yes gene_type:complete
MARRNTRNFARMNDPDLNPQFRRRWTEPESPRKSREPRPRIQGWRKEQPEHKPDFSRMR